MKRLFALLACLLLLLTINVVNFAQQTAPRIVAIKCGRLIDVRTGNVMINAFILIEGEGITAVGANVTVPANAAVPDLSTKTVLPGFIDCHTHLTFDPSQMGVRFTAERAERGKGFSGLLCGLRALCGEDNPAGLRLSDVTPVASQAAASHQLLFLFFAFYSSNR